MMVPPADEDNLAGEQWQELADGFNDLQTNLFQGAFKKQVPWKSEPYIPPLPKVVTSPSEKESETEADAEKPEEPPTVEPAPKVAASDPVPATKPEGLNTQRVVDKQPEPVETKETPEEESEKEESKKGKSKPKVDPSLKYQDRVDKIPGTNYSYFYAFNLIR